MPLYYITDRSQFSGTEVSRRAKLLQKIAEAARCGIDLIQLRERDLPARELASLARAAARTVRENSRMSGDHATALLINSRTDIAIASGADGVHLRSNDISPADIREVWRKSSAAKSNVVISVACHTLEEVDSAARNGATYALFGPVFEKTESKPGASNILPAGLGLLREACRGNIPVIALGGVTLANARLCVDAGATGVAGIRLFQENEIEEAVNLLRK